jgi:hypothetical protein
VLVVDHDYLPDSEVLFQSCLDPIVGNLVVIDVDLDR